MSPHKRGPLKKNIFTLFPSSTVFPPNPDGRARRFDFLFFRLFDESSSDDDCQSESSVCQSSASLTDTSFFGTSFVETLFNAFLDLGQGFEKILQKTFFCVLAFRSVVHNLLDDPALVAWWASASSNSSR